MRRTCGCLGSVPFMLDNRFTVTIDVGNDAMQTLEDIAGTLEGVAERLRMGESSGKVRDLNGNTVGRFTFGYHGKGRRR